MGLIAELRRRNVLRVATAYIVAAWLAMQVAGVLFDLLVLPEGFGPWVMAVLVIGFPIALVVTWFFDTAPEGVVRDAKVPEDQPASIDQILDAIILVGVWILAITLSMDILTLLENRGDVLVWGPLMVLLVPVFFYYVSRHLRLALRDRKPQIRDLIAKAVIPLLLFFGPLVVGLT